MRMVISFMFLAFLPTLAVLGHDLYLHMERENADFMLSAAGFIWAEYHPASLKEIIAGLDGEQKEILQAVLNRKAVELTGALGVVLSCLIIVVKIIAVILSGISQASMNARKRRVK